MNERIKELKHQALVFAQEKCNGQPQDLNGVPRSDIMTEKFAELIVKECGRALNPMLRDMISRGQAVDMIKQHFGVEL
jgi:hypothetical protein